MARHSSNPCQIASDESYWAAADFFLSFSNPISLMILSIVRGKEMASDEISKKLGIEPKTALAKLNAMERHGIFTSRVRSQKTLYKVAGPKILKAFDRILEYPSKRLEQNGSSKKELSVTTQKGNKPSKVVPGISVRQ